MSGSGLAPFNGANPGPVFRCRIQAKFSAPQIANSPSKIGMLFHADFGGSVPKSGPYLKKQIM